MRQNQFALNTHPLCESFPGREPSSGSSKELQIPALQSKSVCMPWRSCSFKQFKGRGDHFV